MMEAIGQLHPVAQVVLILVGGAVLIVFLLRL